MAAETQKPDETISNLKMLSKTEPVAEFLGMKLTSLTPGRARVRMTVQPEHVNFNGAVFGGVIAALADSAFSYASNSMNFPSFAVQFNINFVAGAEVGDKLTAECKVIRSGRRAGVSEIGVTNQAGKTIAQATGVTVPVTKL
jgi:acyl-CoA thioesterase